MTDWDRIALESRRMLKEAEHLQRSGSALTAEATKERLLEFAGWVYALQERLAGVCSFCSTKTV